MNQVERLFQFLRFIMPDEAEIRQVKRELDHQPDPFFRAESPRLHRENPNVHIRGTVRFVTRLVPETAGNLLRPATEDIQICDSVPPACISNPLGKIKTHASYPVCASSLWWNSLSTAFQAAVVGVHLVHGGQGIVAQQAVLGRQDRTQCVRMF